MYLSVSARSGGRRDLQSAVTPGPLKKPLRISLAAAQAAVAPWFVLRGGMRPEPAP